MFGRLLFFVVLLIIAVILLVYYCAGGPGMLPLDDAYIHFVYAKNLASGNGLSFNAGTTSFGTSSPLWTFVLAGCARGGLDVPAAALLLGILSHAAAA